MTTDDMQKLRIIFHEAHVIDLDFSKWDKFLRLVVVAAEIPLTKEEKYALYRVDFCDLLEFHWASRHVGIKLDSELDHCQWTIMDFSIKKVRGGYSVRLPDVGPPSPSIELRCNDISVTEMSTDIVDAVNPYWNRAGGSLARPGLDELRELLRRRSIDASRGRSASKR